MRILLAIDESKHAEAAVRRLIEQIAPRGCQVRVLTVVQPAALSAPQQMAVGYIPDLRDQVREAQALANRAAQTLQAAGFKTEIIVETGDVRERIVDQAAEWEADLILLGSHGRKGLTRFLLGSVAEAVARHAPCSVEIVRIPTGE
ncbi:MAG TPA: universal stress protein [Candidatus Acidoferrales bacterium]|nr:universal stress protein [Candidatus Acidoferrales bacterium]